MKSVQFEDFMLDKLWHTKKVTFKFINIFEKIFFSQDISGETGRLVALERSSADSKCHFFYYLGHLKKKKSYKKRKQHTFLCES